MTLSDQFTTALVLADMPDDDITQMVRAGCDLDEIASRVAARSGVDVHAAQVESWLGDIGWDFCGAIPDGRSTCERPVADINETRCTAHRRY